MAATGARTVSTIHSWMVDTDSRYYRVPRGNLLTALNKFLDKVNDPEYLKKLRGKG